MAGPQGLVRVAVALVVGMLLLAASPPEQQRRAEPAAAAVAKTTAELTAYLDAEYRQELRDSTSRVNPRGRSEAMLDAELAWRRRSVGQMRERFDATLLTEEAKVSYDLWALELERAAAETRWRRHHYVFARGGPQVFLPELLITTQLAQDRFELERYVEQVARLAEELDLLLVRARVAANDGIHMPLFTYDVSLDEIRRVVSGAPFTDGADSAVFADAKAKIAKLELSKAITSEDARRFTRRVLTILIERVGPAYERVAAFLREDKARGQTPDRQGALALPNGAAFYAAQLYLHTTTRMTADEIHELGLAEVARLREEMERAKVAAGFKGTLAELFVFMRTDRRFFLPSDAAGAAEYIARTERHLNAMQARLPQFFGRFPETQPQVRRVDVFRERAAAGQQYFPGESDGSRPAILYLHLSDMSAFSTHQLESSAYHEGAPGHHLQMFVHRRLSGLPDFRTFYSYTAFKEGWALYAEALAKEMGFNADPYSELGRLANEIWRAIRLVVDTGIHARGWSQQRAEEYFLVNSPQPAAGVKEEVERYILRPGQATSYKLGMIAMQRLRDEARAALGARFDYRSFHDALLGGGSLPLPMLEARMRRWIEREKPRLQ